MNVAEKVRMAHQLDRLGVDVIEAGFPIASEGDFEAVRVLRARFAVPSLPPWRAAVPATSSAPGKPWKAPPAPAFTPFWPLPISTCSTSSRFHGATAWNRLATAVKLARSFCKDVQFSAEDATRSDIHFLCEVLEAVIEAGATTLNIPDTVGYRVPAEFAEFMQTLRRRVRGMERRDHLRSLSR